MQTLKKTNTETALAAFGPYFHRKEARVDLRFDSVGSSPRSFTVLVADAVAKGPDNAKAGLAVYDNDNDRIVMDGLNRQPNTQLGLSLDQKIVLALMTEMTWGQFSSYVRKHPSYRGGVADIDSAQGVPAPGNMERQVALGLIEEGYSDIRPAVLREVHADRELPYTFPPASRAAIIADLAAHTLFKTGDDRDMLAWDVRMNFAWNRSGRIEGQDAVDDRFDSRWAKESGNASDIFAQACETALKPYLAEPFKVLDLDDSLPIELDVMGGRGGFVVLKSVNGTALRGKGPQGLATALDALDDQTLTQVWAATRILDVDFSRSVRKEIMTDLLHDARLAQEIEWGEEIEEDELDFAGDVGR